MWNDPFTSQMSEDGCECCGETGTTCYLVQFYLLPRKLIRKKHRDRSRAAIFCRSCYEAENTLPVSINQTIQRLPKKGLNDRQELLHCYQCGHSYKDTKLYGLIASSLWMSGSCIESLPLARFCTECAEEILIDFPKNIRDAG
jgi:hypothetical protein